GALKERLLDGRVDRRDGGKADDADQAREVGAGRDDQAQRAPALLQALAEAEEHVDPGTVEVAHAGEVEHHMDGVRARRVSELLAQLLRVGRVDVAFGQPYGDSIALFEPQRAHAGVAARLLLRVTVVPCSPCSTSRASTR